MSINEIMQLADILSSKLIDISNQNDYEGEFEEVISELSRLTDGEKEQLEPILKKNAIEHAKSCIEEAKETISENNGFIKYGYKDYIEFAEGSLSESQKKELEENGVIDFSNTKDKPKYEEKRQYFSKKEINDMKKDNERLKRYIKSAKDTIEGMSRKDYNMIAYLESIPLIALNDNETEN